MRSERALSRVLMGLSLIALCCAGTACGNRDGQGGGEAPTGGPTAGGGGAGAQGPERVRTTDGYEVIMADPNSRPGATKASRSGELQAQKNREHLVRTPTSPDPKGGRFSIEDAVQGLGVDGTLIVEIGTDLGTIFCDLYTDKTPNTVANFIGLARGMRPWWDARAGAWMTRPYYRDTIFHKVVPGYIVQGGDYLGDGTGTVGYEIPDEILPDLRHDRAGQLCMAPMGPNKNGAQFFITDGAAPQLDGGYTIFGQCRPLETIAHIARVPQNGAPENRPLTPVSIVRIFVRRQVGGAASATRTLPRAPEGMQPPRNATPGPAELYGPAPGESAAPALRPLPTPPAPGAPSPPTPTPERSNRPARAPRPVPTIHAPPPPPVN